MPDTADREGARLDLVVYVPGWATPVTVDVTVTSAVAQLPLAKGSAEQAGKAAELAEEKKLQDYPYAPILPFAIEEHGRLGVRAHNFVKGVAPREPLSVRSSALRALYQALSATLQRTQADAILSAIEVRNAPGGAPARVPAR